MKTVTEPARLLRSRNYMYFQASRVTSLLGSHLSSVAWTLLVLGMGGSAVLAGAMGSAAALARMAFQLPAGYLVDRFDQRRLMLGTDLVCAVAVGSIPVAAALGGLTFAQLFVVALVEGTASAVYTSASVAFVRVVAPAGSFARAVGHYRAAAGTTALLGPAVGGALYGIDRLLPFVVDAASYAVSCALLLAISVGSYRVVRPGAPGAAGSGSPAADRRVTAGLRWLLARRDLRWIVVFAMVLNLVGSAAGMAAVVVMVQRGTPAEVIGVVLACSGLGVVVGSLVAARVVAALRPVPLCLGAGLLWATAMGAVAASASPWMVGATLTAMAVVGAATGVMMLQLLRDEAPEELFGRVISAQQMLGSSLAMAGPVLGGLLVAVFGATVIWLVFAVTCLVTTVLTMGPLLATRPAQQPPVPSPDTAVSLVGNRP